MIAYIEGILLEKTPISVVILTAQGMGYEIFIPSHTHSNLPTLGNKIHLFTIFIVREDAQELFGFETWEERETFKMLIGINRVGARTALSILSTFRPTDLREMVAKGDSLALTKVSGIGKQTGQKIFLELQYKFKDSVISQTLKLVNNTSSIYNDALTGLINLGYQENQVSPILNEVISDEPDLSVSEALRACLKLIAKNKN